MTWSRYDLSGTLYDFTFIVGGIDLGICDGKKTSSMIQSVDLYTRIEVELYSDGVSQALTQ